jgi:hypothetical protein
VLWLCKQPHSCAGQQLLMSSSIDATLPLIFFIAMPNNLIVGG